MPVAPDSWKATIGALYPTAPPAPKGRVPKVKARRPGHVTPTPGAPRTTSDWNKAISSLGLGGGNGRGVEANKYGKITLAGLADIQRNGRGPVTERKDEGWSLGGFLANVGGDIKDIVTGLPGAVQLGVGQVAGVTALPFGLLPGSAGQAARSFATDRFKEIGSTAKAVASDTKHRWWDQVAHGDFRPLYEDPVISALDVAAVVSGGQTAVIKGAQAGRAAGLARTASVARDARVVKATRGVRLGPQKRAKGVPQTREVEAPYPGPENVTPTATVRTAEGRKGLDPQQGGPRRAEVRPAWLRQVVEGVGDPALAGRLESGGRLADATKKIAASTSYAARYRAPIVVREEDWLNDPNAVSAVERAKGSRGPEVGISQTLEYQRRLAPSSPLGRAIQGNTLIRAGEALRSPGVGLSKVPGIEPLSTRLNQRLQRKATRQMADKGVLQGTELLHDAGVRKAVDKVRRVLKDPHAGAATVAHAEGHFTARQIDGVDVSPQDLRDKAVATATRNLEKLKKESPNNPSAWAETEAQIKLISEIPDELITLTGDSKRVRQVREAVEAVREVAPLLEDAQTGATGLSKLRWRDAERERRTLSQRVLLGGAEHIDNAGPSHKNADGTRSGGRVVVPREHFRMIEELGMEHVGKKKVRRTLEKVAQIGRKQTGSQAQQWLRHHHRRQLDRINEIKNPMEREREAFRLYDNLSKGRLRDSDGNAAGIAERADAEQLVKETVAHYNQQKSAATSKETLYRVRGPRGATHWVPADFAGSPDRVPTVLQKRGLRDEERIEKITVPTRVAEKYQTPDGTIQGLAPGHLAHSGVSHVGRNGGTGRYALSPTGVRKVVGQKAPKGGKRPYGLSRSLETDGLTPAARKAIDEHLAPQRYWDEKEGRWFVEDPAVNQVARELLASGEVKFGPHLSLPKKDVAELVISRFLDRRMRGHIPIDENGLIDWDKLTPRLLQEPALRARFNAPELLSEVPLDEGAVYMEHVPVDAMGKKRGTDRGSDSGVPPVGPVETIKRTEGSLAARYGQNMDPAAILATWDRIAKSTGTKDFFHGFLDVFAAKTESGELRTFDATEASRLDPERWATIPVNQIQHLQDALKDWNPQHGNVIPGFDGNQLSFSPKNLDKTAGQVYVIPRAAAREVQWSFRNPHWVVQKYDNFLQAWRAGVLALAPRWIVNNYAGNSLFLGMFNGADVLALKASRKSRDLLPHEIEGHTFSGQGAFDPTQSLITQSDLKAHGKLSRGYFRLTDRVYRVNGGVESMFRRAAYIHATKVLLKREGRAPDFKGLGLSRDEKAARMIEAVAEAPDWLKAEAMRNMKQWMGDYSNLTQFERQAMRRIVPFYTWVRVINTWLFGLPFRSPLRAEMLSLASQMGREAQGDRSYLPWWEQGRIELPGGYSLRTSGINPLMSVLEGVSAVTGNKDAGLMERLAMAVRSQGGGLTPPVAALGGMLYGKQAFGNRDYTAPLGFGGTVSPFGSDPQYVNSVTGQIESRATPGNPMEEVLQMLPFVPLIRDALAYGERPYDSASTPDLLAHRLFGKGDPNDLFQPPQKNGGQGRNKIPVVSGLAGMLGAPIYQNDADRERQSNWERVNKFGRDKRANRALRGRQEIGRLLQSGEFRGFNP